MGLFSNPTIDGAIAALFGKKTKKEDLIKAKEQESNPVPQRVEDPVPEPTKTVSLEAVDSGEDSDNEVDLEDNYVRKMARKQGIAAEAGSNTSIADETNAENLAESDSESQVESDENTNANLSADQSIDSTNDPKEPVTDDLENTIFVKNVPNAVITDRKALKEFKKLFGPEIKSVRFRSIAMSELVPRKVGFIKQKLHPGRDAVNSYIVYKSKDRVYEALNELNGHEFMDHHLFVDSAFRPRPQAAGQSIFIGNLSFDATEEQLYRKFIECGPIENLRIVRDRKYNIGKGFAYVQFADVSTVQLALLQNGQDFEGRPLRVTRCSKREQQQKQQQGSSSSKKRHAAGRTAERSFKQKQTERSRKGKPRHKQQLPAGTVLEGERAKAGDTIELGRKRKPRHDKSGGRPKKARK